jgi:hypothetical protein
MKMQYDDGTSGDDPLFDQPEDLHRVYIAGCMGYNCNAPETWPVDLIDKMIAVRRHEGLGAFHYKLRRLFTP